MKVRTTLRDALSDPRLLGNALPGETWLTWRAVLLATMGEPLNGEELAAYQAVTGREAAPDRPVEEMVVIAGRRGGKSRAIAVLSTYLATLVNHNDVLVAGERALILCIALDVEQATVVHGYIEGILEESAVLRSLIGGKTVGKNGAEIRLTNGISIKVRSAHWRRLRGPTCVAVICDEACFWYGDEGSANRDTEILDAVRPSLATTGGLLAIISTPYARRGATWEAFSKNYGPSGDPAILVATGASATFNPSLPARVIERAYERDPVAAAAEYGGEWRTDISAVLPREAVLACVENGVRERPWQSAFTYSAFVDPSGGSSDSMTLGIAHKEDDAPVLDLVREVRPPFSPESVVEEFCETLVKYRINTVCGDRYAGEWPREQFKNRGIRYEPTKKSASQIFIEFIPLVNDGRARLLDHRRLSDQLIRLERRTGFGTGRDVVGHPPGAHDDLAVCAAGALLLAVELKPKIRIGAIAEATTGKVSWRDDEPRPRVSWVTVSEAEAPAVSPFARMGGR